MTQQKIEIFKLDIDIGAVTSKTSDLKKQTDRLKKGLDDLKKSGDTNSETYVRMKGSYDDLNKQYRSSQQELSKLINLQGKEIKTVTEAKNALSVINKEWSDQAKLYGENSKAAEDLANKKLELTERLKELEKATGDNTRNVGNYTESMKEAFGSLNIFNGGIGDFITKSKESGGAGAVLKSSLNGAAQGFKSLTKSALAFIATPVGAILAVLVGAFALIKNAMNRSEESTNKIKKAFSAFKGITNGLLKILEPLGAFLIDGLVKGFELAEKAVYKGLETISKGLKLLGFDDAAASLDKFNHEVQESAKYSKALADAEAKLQKSQRESQKIQLEFQKDAEKLRQIRDDESKSMNERIKANEDLGLVLKQQLQEELNIAQLALEAANLRIQAEGQTKEALDSQAEALTRIADIQERVTGQESEQLTNRVSLQKEASEKYKEIADKAIQDQEEQLELFIQQQGVRAKTLQEQLEISKDVYKREVEILDANLKNRNISQTKYDAELLKLKNDLLQQQAELTIDNAQSELDEYIKNHQSKIDSDLFFSEESLRVEQDRLNAIAEKRREFADKQLEEGVLSQQDYNDAINLINEENRIALEEAQLERDEAKKEQQAVDLENQRILDEEKFLNDYEIKSAQLEEQRKQEIAAAEKTGADTALINKKYANLQNTIDEELKNQKLSIYSEAFGGVAKLLGEHTAAGKAAGIAQATINTYQGVTEVWKSPSVLPEPANSIVKGVATIGVLASGLSAVRKIRSTETPKAEQGALFDVGGNRHYAGGTKFYGEDGSVFEAEQGELIGVMNRRAAMMFKDFNDEHRGNSSSTQNYLAGGGFVQTQSIGRNTAPSAPQFNIDYAAMSQMIGQEVAQAYRQIPAPVVSVEDINYGQSSYAKVVNRADL